VDRLLYGKISSYVERILEIFKRSYGGLAQIISTYRPQQQNIMQGNRFMNDALISEVRTHIQKKYSGIFTPEHMERHFRDYVGFDLAMEQLQQVRDLSRINSGKSLLDIGCGYGSFVLVCRRAGFDARGIDIGEFDIEFARKRNAAENPGENAADIFHLGDGQRTGFEDASFDVVTAWNLLEHVPDFRQLIREAFRVLKPGGSFIGIAPNYLAFRQEAHYHVPWLPLFPRPLAHKYLLRRGLDPRFFDEDIHYVTAWGVQKALKVAGFTADYPEKNKFDNPELIHSEKLRSRVNYLQTHHLMSLLRCLFWLRYWNPLKQSIYFVARKPG
jgi:2-polyprenyl-3-methyl-5-hydroxy-6-metoxy-1,4-benzoquinol methylase